MSSAKAVAMILAGSQAIQSNFRQYDRAYLIGKSVKVANGLVKEHGEDKAVAMAYALAANAHFLVMSPESHVKDLIAHAELLVDEITAAVEALEALEAEEAKASPKQKSPGKQVSPNPPVVTNPESKPTSYGLEGADTTKV